MSVIERYSKFLKEKNIDFVPDWNSKKDKREIAIPLVCENQECEKKFTITLRNLLKKDNRLCWNCFLKSEEVGQKKKQTCLKNLGVDHPAKSEDVKKKMRETCMKNLGVENPSQSDEVKQKMKETCMKNLGVDHPFKSDEVKKKWRESCLENLGVDNPSKSDDVKKKKKETCLKNLGVDHPFKSEDVKKKKKETWLENLGVDNPFKSDEVKKKKKETCLKNLGVDHPSKSEEVKRKMKETCLETYDCPYPMQNPEIFEKQQKNARKFKKMRLPSGKEVSYQGYEGWVINYLLNSGFQEEDIGLGRKEIPSFWYKNQKGEKHKYYPDIFLKSQNTIIEVKSEYTFQHDEDKINACRQVIENSGYKFQVWVVDFSNDCHFLM